MDVVFAPGVGEIYPDGFDAAVSVGGLTAVLEGDPSQRGEEHFEGVTTVVTKLFNIVQPDAAWFGQKDAQQALVIHKLVRDLDIPVRVEVVPTVRDGDGLALSSRNAYLSPEERERAHAIGRALRAAEQRWRTARSPPPTSWTPPAPSSSGPASIPSTSSSGPQRTSPPSTA